MEPLLKIEDLYVTFRPGGRVVQAVDGISFTIGKGECVGLVGESGSGKSVTALSLMRLIDFVPGEKTVSGKIDLIESASTTDLMALSPDEMRRIRGVKMAMIFQEPMQSLNPVFSCGHQILEAVRLHGNFSEEEAQARTMELLQQVRLRDPERVFRSYPYQISGGQKQRVLIAIALAGQPDLLIADEPTTALDVHVQKSILDLLNDLRQEFGMSMLFISHDLGVISEVAERVLVMRQGKLIEEGKLEQVFESPIHPYTKGLLACRPSIKQKTYRLPVLADFQDAANAAKASITDSPTSMAEITRKETAPILQTKGLKVYFQSPVSSWFGASAPPVKAVDGVDFSLWPGETLGLVGASGSGKTTIGRALIRLVPLTAGKVIFRGQEVQGLEEKAWRKVQRHLQMVFQDPFASLNPRLSIGEAIREPLNVHGLVNGKKAQQDRVVELLELVGLEADHYHRAPYAFSGGQRQRICIARALALEPDFLICDECVSALDVSIQAQVLNLLKDLQEQLGFASIFISHDLAVVNFMADRMLVLDDGVVVEEGMVEAIYENPQSDITRRLIEASL